MQLFCTPSISTSRQFVAAIVSLLLHSEGLSSTEFTSSSSTFLLLCSLVSGSGILSTVSSLKSFASMPYFSSLRDRVYNKWILTRFFNDCLRNYFPERLKCSDKNVRSWWHFHDITQQTTLAPARNHADTRHLLGLQPLPHVFTDFWNAARYYLHTFESGESSY